MRIVVFGLSVSSSWGNRHATFWRGLIRGLAELGHSVVFFEHEVPYYAANRECRELPNGELRLYADFEAVRARARAALREADVGLVTTLCPDGAAATELVLDSAVTVKAFYDLDTPITLDRLERGQPVPTLGPAGLHEFDIVLSSTGGPALARLSELLGARHVVPLYGGVDPNVHLPVPALDRYRADLSYLGTYAEARQHALTQLFMKPAQALPHCTFAIGGSLYPIDFAWSHNINYLWHVPAREQASFFCSSRLNLSVTRAPMAAMGFCPSSDLFEVAACGGAIISDAWPGLDQFYAPGSELLLAQCSEDVIDALSLSDGELSEIGRRARERTLVEHTMSRRAEQLVEMLEGAHASQHGRGNTAAVPAEV